MTKTTSFCAWPTSNGRGERDEFVTICVFWLCFFKLSPPIRVGHNVCLPAYPVVCLLGHYSA